MPQAVLLVFSVAEGALASDGVGPRQRDVLLQQHGQDLVVIPMGGQDDGGHVHGGGVLRVLDPLHQFLQQNCFSWSAQEKTTREPVWKCENTDSDRGLGGPPGPVVEEDVHRSHHLGVYGH